MVLVEVAAGNLAVVVDVTDLSVLGGTVTVALNASASDSTGAPDGLGPPL
jgi:hypothetical protein